VCAGVPAGEGLAARFQVSQWEAGGIHLPVTRPPSGLPTHVRPAGAGRKATASSAKAISPNQLPESIRSYLVAHQARDLDTAVGYYTEDAVVVDEGDAHRGPKQIRDWLATAASEYTYTIELTGASQIDDDHTWRSIT
jgi:SnoaL-like domain